ncbi:MAG: hypothetical protein ACRDJM_06855 [Actinomycetota bacterium]
MARKTVGALLAAVAIMSAFGVANARGAGQGVKDCGDGHQITWSPKVIWPPSHKYETVTITYSDTNPEHTLTLTITRVSHDEMVDESTELNGAGNTPFATDGVITNPGGTGNGSVQGTVDVRSERSGRGDGRVYTIEYTATSTGTDDEGNTTTDDDCSGSIAVSVPHDCRGGACKGTNNGGGKPR